MPLDRFLIAPEEVGLETDLRPWMIPDTAYEQLNNAYVFRGRIRKRFGSQYMTAQNSPVSGFEQYPSRLGLTLYATNNVGTPKLTNGAGLVTGNVLTDTGSATLPLAIGLTFSIGTQVFTVVSTTAGPQPMKSVDTATGLISGASTFDVTTGNYSLQTAPILVATGVKFYPGLPVMGLPVWQTSSINNQPTVAFDTRFAYQFLANGWERLNLEATPGDAVWLGTDSQFFWAYTYQGQNLYQNFMFVSNFNQNETHFMRYIDNNFTWNSFAPIYATPDGTTINGKVISARIIVGFHDHLVLLNTYEVDSVLGTNNFKNRARYSAIGTPIDTPNGVPANSYLPWIDNKNSAWFRGGGYIDNLQTQEEIVSAEFIKDRLIVYYSRSSWELVYTGNQQLPFVWQQINTEFGAQSTFSKVPFDREVLAIAQNGITSCTGANVTRIDEKIPDEVFKIRQDNSGVLRVQGIRDYKPEMVYWSIPISSIAAVDVDGNGVSDVYPNQVLTYNYRTKSWAYNTDSFTAFGYFNINVASTWGNTITQWQYMTATWSDGDLQANERKVIAGNQEGYVLYLNADLTRNAGALQISNMSFIGDVVLITAINHNLINTNIYTLQEEYVLLENISGSGSWPLLNGVITPILSILDDNRFTVQAFPFAAGSVYYGGGTVARVSNINILSKQWNPYNKSGQNVFIQKINFLVDRTSNGQVQVDYYPSTSKLSTLTTAIPGQLMSSGVLETSPYDPLYYPLEEFQDRLWHPQYLACDGNAIQIRISMNANQMVNPNISLADFQLHGLILETMPTSVRIGG